MNEVDFESQLRDLIKLYQWDVAYHTHDSRHSAQGFPDWVLIRGERAVILELKGSRGKLSDAQALMLEIMRLHGKFEVYAFWPEDADLLAEVMR